MRQESRMGERKSVVQEKGGKKSNKRAGKRRRKRLGRRRAGEKI